MNLFVQYHNLDHEDLPLTDPPFQDTQLNIRTRRPLKSDLSGQVFLIAGMGKPREYYLWETFQIEKVEKLRNGEYIASGTGWQLSPPQRLSGRAFNHFQQQCANFVGFRDITDLRFAPTLQKLANKYRRPCSELTTRDFLTDLLEVFPLGSPDRAAINDALAKISGDNSFRAISIRQPFVEAIFRGTKLIEYRSKKTHIRGRVQIYASASRFSAEDEAHWVKHYRLKGVDLDSLPRGVLVGTVELYDCYDPQNGNDMEWHLRDPIRFKELIPPKNQPQPVWFIPFDRDK